MYGVLLFALRFLFTDCQLFGIMFSVLFDRIGFLRRFQCWFNVQSALRFALRLCTTSSVYFCKHSGVVCSCFALRAFSVQLSKFAGGCFPTCYPPYVALHIVGFSRQHKYSRIQGYMHPQYIVVLSSKNPGRPQYIGNDLPCGDKKTRKSALVTPFCIREIKKGVSRKIRKSKKGTIARFKDVWYNIYTNKTNRRG